MAGIRVGTAAGMLVLAAMLSAEAEASPAGAMSVEKVEPGADRIEVRTTGAIYVLEPAGDRVRVSQRVNVEREVAAVSFRPGSLKALRVTKQDAAACEMSSGDVRITVARDSAMFVEPKDAVLKVEPLLPGAKPGDEKGGYSLHNDGERTSFKDRWVLSVFPPREFDYERYFAGGWLWCSDPPSDEVLERAQKAFAPRYVHIHNPLWKGWWMNRDFVCTDLDRLRRSIETAHRLGMKVELYLNHVPARDTEEKLTEVLQNLPQVKASGADGVYWDEIGDTLPLRYRLLTETRRILGPDVSVQIHDSRYYREPFVDGYADWVISGEHVDFPTIEQGRQFLAAYVSRFNRSNAIGLYDWESRWACPREFLDQMLTSFVHNMGAGLIDPDGFPFFYKGRFYASRPAPITRRIIGYYGPMLEAGKWDYLGRTGKVAGNIAGANAAEARAKAEAFLKEEASLLQKGEVQKGVAVKALTASRHVEGDYPRGFWQPSWACDGSVATGAWMSAEPDAQITIEFDGEKSLASILYDTHFPGCKAEDVWQSAFTISLSLDGKTWAPAVERQGLEKAGRFMVDLKAPVRARFLKAHGIRGERRLDPAWHWSYVTEIQAYEAR